VINSVSGSLVAMLQIRVYGVLDTSVIAVEMKELIANLVEPLHIERARLALLGAHGLPSQSWAAHGCGDTIPPKTLAHPMR
jgi:hypothetical protein